MSLHILASREQVPAEIVNTHPNFLFGVVTISGDLIGTVHLDPNGTYLITDSDDDFVGAESVDLIDVLTALRDIEAMNVLGEGIRAALS